MTTTHDVCAESVRNALSMGRVVVMPEVRSFADLFESAECYDLGPGEPAPILATWRNGKETTRLSSYCPVRVVNPEDGDPWHLLVQPDWKLKDWVKANMLLLDRDTIHFEVVVRPNGTALVLATYNIILGSRWLAVVDAATVPRPAP